MAEKIGHDGTEQVTEKEVVKQVNGTQLKALLKLAEEVADDAADGRKKVKDAINELREKKHVHVDQWCFGKIKELKELSAESLADRLDNFQFYLDISGLTDKAKRASRLALDRGTTAGETAALKGDGKVTPLRAAE